VACACLLALHASRRVRVCVRACRNGDWPNRSLYLTLGKLCVDVAKLLTYVAYFLILFANYGMPLIMVRARLGRHGRARRREEGRGKTPKAMAPFLHILTSPSPIIRRAAVQVRDLVRAFVDVNAELANLVASRRLRTQVRPSSAPACVRTPPPHQLTRLLLPHR